ncbi:hypothetical protein [Novosphingobium sp. ZW T3_23]|uniref:hypothetical protein n=1 Tax=Novosphingobium sp. ZW T3_23 TaxID=3378084 RepID=UPI0038545144
MSIVFSSRMKGVNNPANIFVLDSAVSATLFSLVAAAAGAALATSLIDFDTAGVAAATGALTGWTGTFLAAFAGATFATGADTLGAGATGALTFGAGDGLATFAFAAFSGAFAAEAIGCGRPGSVFAGFASGIFETAGFGATGVASIGLTGLVASDLAASGFTIAGAAPSGLPGTP